MTKKYEEKMSYWTKKDEENLKNLLIRKQKYEEEKEEKERDKKSKELYRLMRRGDVLYPRVIGLQAASLHFH